MNANVIITLCINIDYFSTGFISGTVEELGSTLFEGAFDHSVLLV